uniref:Uncharacterized protein n=1 Tax=Moniliophthora roreri TaxID=221103 RepID=A0A0W0FRJ7_MONRR
MPPNRVAPGAKLAKMTQSLAYKHIRQRKQAKQTPRRRTVEMIEKIKLQIEELFGFTPTEKAIWRALRNRDYSKKAQQFLWKNAHDTYMVGDKWLRGNFSEELKERAQCAYCQGKIESMEHILTECEAPGQSKIWDLTKDLWERKNTTKEWFKPGIGGILGAALAETTGPEIHKIGKGPARLWKLLVTESAYLIWVLRCERVIRNNNAPAAEQQIINRWRHSINERLNLDRRLTDPKYERKALNQSTVKETWKGIIEKEGALPENWVTNTGVLVDIVSQGLQEGGEER